MSNREESTIPDTYTELYYHLVWSTRKREPFITPDMQPVLYQYLQSKCREIGVFVHALNGMPDHLHLVCGIPPSLSIAQVMHQVKGASAHHINHRPESGWSLQWQPGYGALTFRKRDLRTIVQYVERQEEHHRASTVSHAMERYEGDIVESESKIASVVREARQRIDAQRRVFDTVLSSENPMNRVGFSLSN